jgi:SLT domain-containing protein
MCDVCIDKEGVEKAYKEWIRGSSNKTEGVTACQFPNLAFDASLRNDCPGNGKTAGMGVESRGFCKASELQNVPKTLVNYQRKISTSTTMLNQTEENIFMQNKKSKKNDTKDINESFGFRKASELGHEYFSHLKNEIKRHKQSYNI